MLRVLVSACLVGEPVRYDAQPAPVDCELLRRWQAEGRVLSFCPELAAGLGAPRPPTEIRGGNGDDVLDGHARVFDRTGCDGTDALVRGANEAVAAARASGVRLAVLKERSPSCGTSIIYDGTFSGRRVPGSGVLAAMLRRCGFAVFSENQLAEAEECLRRLEEE